MLRLLLAAALLAVPPAARAAALFAGRITAENAAERQVGGPDAVAGVGDVAFGNGVICAAISDPSHESDLSDRGGVLVDLGHCGRGDDQWASLQPLQNLSRSQIIPMTELRAEVVDGTARAVTVGRSGGIEVETAYALSDEPAEALRIRTRITRRAPGERLFAHGLVVLHPSAALRPFSLLRDARHRSRGFHHPGGDPDHLFSMLGAIGSVDLLVWVGSPGMGPPISYGLEWVRATLVDTEGSSFEVGSFSIIGSSYTLVGALARPVWVGDDADPGLVELAQLPLMDLAVGESLVLEQRLWVGRRADAASITDRVWPEAPVLRGTLGAPGVVVHVDAEDGEPLTAVRTDAHGRFEARVPEGKLVLRVRGANGKQTRRAIDHAEGDAPVRLVPPAPGRVRLPRGQPMRLVFRGVGGTPDPVLRSDEFGLEIDGAPVGVSRQSNDVPLSGHPSDPQVVALAPGRYRVYAMRGPEHGVRETELEVGAGEEVLLSIAPPPRLFELPGWVSADLHVHTGASFDSALPPRLQVAAFHAAGAQVLVATEHDRVVDPRPTIALLGLSAQIAGVTGVEVTSEYRGGESPFTIGHANAFPLDVQPEAYRGGAPRAEGRRLRDVWAELRARGVPLLQLNHPRASLDPADGHSFLNHLGVGGSGFDPSRPLASHTSLLERGTHGFRDLDFDAIELLNGSDHEAYARVRADWFSLHLQGKHLTGTANSDSHDLRHPVAVPRNYVRLAGGVADFDAPAFAVAVRRGELWGTTGPLLDVSLDGTGVGGTHRGPDAALRASVRAAPWVPVRELRVYVNGVLAERRELAVPAVEEIPLHFAEDAFVTVEVVGEPEGLYATLLPGFRPLAFTNAIYVDAEADGSWTPPGLPPTRAGW